MNTNDLLKEMGVPTSPGPLSRPLGGTERETRVGYITKHVRGLSPAPERIRAMERILAKARWEAVNLNSRRILFRRAK